MRRSTLLWVLALSMAAAAGSVALRHQTSASVSAFPENQRAFLNARWGMTPDEVSKANTAVLQPVTDNKRFYYDAQADSSRYRSFEQTSVRFLGRYANVTYTFHDGRLFTYHVFLSDTRKEALDGDMRRYLRRQFGDNASEQEEGSSLKLVWQFKGRMANYWFLEDDLALIPKYTAGFGVTSTDS